MSEDHWEQRRRAIERGQRAGGPAGGLAAERSWNARLNPPRRRSLIDRIREVCTAKGVCHIEKDLGLEVDHQTLASKEERLIKLIRGGVVYCPRPGYVKPTS